MSHPLADDADLEGLKTLVELGNPAPHAGRIYVPGAGLDVLSASPEAFLIRRAGRIESRPIKGTATTLASMLAKDYAENVMITDLVRNDLSAVCRPGTVGVDALCMPEEQPGLTHLVTRISGQMRPGVGWAEVISATFPPGSVSGAPKSSALRVIAERECAAWAVLRGDRMGGCGHRRGGACRRHPDLLDGSGRHRTTMAQVRHRRRDHRGVGSRPGVG